jgi:hypothetical protein
MVGCPGAAFWLSSREKSITTVKELRLYEQETAVESRSRSRPGAGEVKVKGMLNAEKVR